MESHASIPTTWPAIRPDSRSTISSELQLPRRLCSLPPAPHPWSIPTACPEVPAANLKPPYAAKSFAFSPQNDWKVGPNLTLNLGLRWDVQPGVTERYNRLSGIDLTKDNPFGTKGVIAFPGTNGYSRNLWDTE